MIDFLLIQSYLQNIDLLSTLQKSILASAVLLFGLLLAYLTLIQPNRQQLVAALSSLSLQKQAQQELVSPNINYSSQAQSVLQLAQNIPTVIDLPSLINKVNALANSRNLAIAAIKVVETPHSQTTEFLAFKVTSIQLSATGNFIDQAAFISDLSALDSVSIATQWQFHKQQADSISTNQGASGIALSGSTAVPQNARLMLSTHISFYHQQDSMIDATTKAQSFITSNARSKATAVMRPNLLPLFEYIPYLAANEKDIFALKNSFSINKNSSTVLSTAKTTQTQKNRWIMLGTMQKDQIKWGLIGTENGKIITVQEGDFINGSRAVVSTILDSDIAITDLLQDEQGNWFQQDYVITMQQEKKQ